MVNDIVVRVKSEWGKSIAIEAPKPEEKSEGKKEKKPKESKPRKPREKKETPAEQTSKPAATAESIPETCPLCGKGKVIKGKTAYGCSEWKSGCTFRIPFKEQ